MESAAVWLDIDQLIPWDQNPRFNDGAIDKVAISIKRFGFASPIIARKEDNTIIAGHTRWEAAKTLGLDRVPVRFMDLDPSDAKLLAIADNKLGEYAEWDNELLSEILEDLNEEGLDLEFSGFTEDELSEFLDIEFSEEDEDEDPYMGDGDSIPTDYESFFKEGMEKKVGKHRIICSDCVVALKSMPDNSVDAICCDPPYGIDFMNRKWDSSVPQNEWADECYRVLKPGGHLIAFAATRTIHRLTTIVENSNFEIRDMITWNYESGFPKSMAIDKAIDKHFGAERKVVGKQKLTGTAKPMKGKKGHAAAKTTSAMDSYEREDVAYMDITEASTPEAKKMVGWGTALKPSYEPAVLARKPISEKSIAENVLKWGTGGINIDKCRFSYGDDCWIGKNKDSYSYENGVGGQSFKHSMKNRVGEDYNPYAGEDDFRSSEYKSHPKGRFPANTFLCKKANQSERDKGCDDLKGKQSYEITNRKKGSAGSVHPRSGRGGKSELKNFHPTVKPVKLMNWLVNMITPEGGTVVDTFCGSGTTLVAAEIAGVSSIGIEMNPEYCDIIHARLKSAVIDD
jgi:DNA modification methylase